MSFPTPTRSHRIAFVLCTAALLCMPVGTVKAQAARPFEAFSNSARTIRDSVVQMAKAQVGKRYRRGGTAPDKGFDCSGLVKYVLSALNVGLPRTARQQAGVGLEVNRDTSQLLPGDLLTFAKAKKGVSHIGIYIGDGKYVHASSGAGRVIVSNIDRPHSSLIKMWFGARRVLADSTTSVALVAPRP